MYKVYDLSSIQEPQDLQNKLNEADEKGYELLQVLESRGLQIVLRRKAKDPTKD